MKSGGKGYGCTNPERRRWVLVDGQRDAPTALPPGKSPQNPLEGRLGGLQDQGGLTWRKDNLAAPLGFEPRISQPIAIRYNLLRNPINNIHI
jgi:hypothetical protein